MNFLFFSMQRSSRFQCTAPSLTDPDYAFASVLMASAIENRADGFQDHMQCRGTNGHKKHVYGPRRGEKRKAEQDMGTLRAAAEGAGPGVASKSPAQDLVRQMRADGLSDERTRTQLKAQGFSKSRISQLLRAKPCSHGCKPLERGANLHGSPGRRLDPSLARKRAPPINLDELRQLGEASALEVARELAKNGLRSSARLSCQYLGVSTGQHTSSLEAPALRNSMLVFVWRLAASGMERVALARKTARGDAIAKFVPLPNQLKIALQVEACYDKVRAEAQRVLPAMTFNLRLGVPRRLGPPPHPYAPGAAVMIRLPSGRRVEHVLCAHVSGELWYSHAGSPKEGDLNIVNPFRTHDLVVQNLASCWHPWPTQRKRLRGRCVKRGLAAAAAQYRACFERVVAMARWAAEVDRAKRRRGSMHLAAATAGVDFSEEAFQAAAANPWTSTILAVWEWAAEAPLDRPRTHLCPGVQVCHDMRDVPYRLFCSSPQEVLPDARTV